MIARPSKEHPSLLDNQRANLLGLGVFQYALTPRERFLDSNHAFLHILGYGSRRELFKKKLDQIFANARDLKEIMHTLHKEGRVRLFETTVKTPSRRSAWVAASLCLVQKGRTRLIEGVFQDVSPAHKERERIVQEMDFLQSFLDQMPDAIYFKDKKCRITKVNRFYANGFRMKPEEIIGKTDFDFFPKDQAQKMLEDDQKVMKTGSPIIGKIERTLLPNNTWNQVITTKVPLYDRKGKIVGIMGVTRDMTAHANLERDRFTMLLNALAVLNKALEMRDPYTFSHARNVGKIAAIIGERLGFDENRMMGLRIAADLHDLGKISVPSDILTKPGKLSALEYRLIQEHVEKCRDLIRDIKFPFPLAEIIYQHHERMDGSGYPSGTRGGKILLEAKILAVSDVLESMTSHRPYRAALGIQSAMKELKDGMGIKYDRKIVNLVFDIINEHKGKIFWPQE